MSFLTRDHVTTLKLYLILFSAVPGLIPGIWDLRWLLRPAPLYLAGTLEFLLLQGVVPYSGAVLWPSVSCLLAHCPQAISLGAWAWGCPVGWSHGAPAPLLLIDGQSRQASQPTQLGASVAAASWLLPQSHVA